jgi:hypothetical protein
MISLANTLLCPDNFIVVLEKAGLKAGELSGYCREQGLYPEDV